MNSDLDFKLNHDADASSKLAEMFFFNKWFIGSEAS